MPTEHWKKETPDSGKPIDMAVLRDIHNLWPEVRPRSEGESNGINKVTEFTAPARLQHQSQGCERESVGPETWHGDTSTWRHLRTCNFDSPETSEGSALPPC